MARKEEKAAGIVEDGGGVETEVMAYNETEAVRDHYDRVSPHYKDLWGPHIHHGYFPTGTETREAAVENLIKLIVQRSGISNGSRVLDVGCGLGGTAIWLAEKMDCKVIGITISPVQVEIATEMSKHLRTRPDFRLDDANRLSVSTCFDSIWAVEVLAHLSDRTEFFKRASRLLLPGGKFCIGAWLKNQESTGKRAEKIVSEIERGMLVSLPTESEYRHHCRTNGLRLNIFEDISDAVAPTWNICVSLIKDTRLWHLAAQHGAEFLAFLTSFRAMRAGFASGDFKYAVMVLEKV